MQSWGGLQACLFCGESDETRDHLFFACPYIYTVWLDISGDLLDRKPGLDRHATPPLHSQL